MRKVRCIGIIAEDDSDYECFKILIKKITGKSPAFKKAIGDGCGKLRRKASSYANDLHRRGCDMLILIHDLDRNNLSDLKKELDLKLSNSPISNKLICIPIEEVEGWFLSDPQCLKEIFSLRSVPKIKGAPETIPSPKEHIEKIVKSHSSKNMIYLNTKHNSVIANKVSVTLLNDRCSSFKVFHDFVLNQKY